MKFITVKTTDDEETLVNLEKSQLHTENRKTRSVYSHRHEHIHVRDRILRGNMDKHYRADNTSREQAI